MEASVPESSHARFTLWTKDQGIKVNGVRPAKTPNGGLGIVANRAIKVFYFKAGEGECGC